METDSTRAEKSQDLGNSGYLKRALAGGSRTENPPQLVINNLHYDVTPSELKVRAIS